MRAGERDFLLLVLAAAAGASDGWSYTELGHAFVANMTGNTVLMGLAVFGKGSVEHPAISVACYAAGAMAATFLARGVREGAVWARAVSWVLLLEGGIMATAEAVWAAMREFPSGAHVPVEALLGCVAFAIGMQSGAMLRLKVPGVVTTYITGTWTMMASNVVKLGTVETKRPESERVRFEERVALQGGVLVIYFLAAVVTGWTSTRVPAAVGVVPAGAVMVAAVYGLVRG